MSSLPKLKQEITENPSKHAVTAPNDPRIQEEDIDRKMRLYGIFEAFRNGKLPSNSQIDQALDHFSNTAPFDTNKLSTEGQDLIEGFRGVVQQAKQLILVKNKDELIQNFIWNTTNIDAQAHKENIKSISAPTDKSTAQSEGQQAVENLKVLAKLIFTNSEVRKLLSDVSVIGRDIAADAAAKAAEAARPDQEALEHAERPAPDSQWIGPSGEKRGPNEPVPDTGIGAKVDTAKNVASEAKDQAKSAAQEQGQQSQQRIQNQADPNDPEQSARVAKDEASNVASAAKGHAQTAKSLIPSGALPDNPGQKAREIATARKEDTKEYLKEKFPEERRDRFIYRLKKVVVEQQQHDDYTDAVEFFLDMAEKYKGHAQDIKDQGLEKGVGSVRTDPAYQNAEMELRVLLERFANNTSMQPILDAIDVLYTDAQNDPELRKWWSQADEYVRRVLLEEGYVMTDECTNDGKRLKESGKHFWDERYRGHRENLFESIEDFAHAYNEDPLNKKFGESVKQLIKDLALDGEGNLKYKPHIISDLRNVIIPSVTKQIGYIPIPRLEYVDKSFEVVLENLTVEMTNLLPNQIELEARNFWKLSPYDNLGDYSQHGFTIGFSHIQADLRDVAFLFRKTKGFFKPSDQGLADVQITGKGIYGQISLETAPDDESSVFRVKDVTIHIDNLAWKVRDSKHNFLYNSLRATAGGLIKNAIAKAVQAAIRASLAQLDSQLTDIRDSYNEGKRRDDMTRTEAVKQRLQEKKAKTEENAQKAKEKKEERGAEFNVVTSRDQEKVNWESPNSYVGKQGTVKEIAHKGDANGWKSPAFDIWKPTPARHEGIVNQKLKEY